MTLGITVWPPVPVTPTGAATASLGGAWLGSRSAVASVASTTVEVGPLAEDAASVATGAAGWRPTEPLAGALVVAAGAVPDESAVATLEFMAAGRLAVADAGPMPSGSCE